MPPITSAEFKQVYESHKDALFFFLLRLVGDEAAAADLLQDCLINFYNHYKDREDLEVAAHRPILFRIARNLAINYSRSFHERRVIPAGDRAEPTSSAAGPEEVVLKELNRAEIQATLDRLLGRLPEDQRVLLLLRHDQGCDLAEIGRIVGVSQSNVTRRLQKAERALLSEARAARIKLEEWLS